MKPNLSYKKGVAQLSILIGLLIIAIALPLTAKLAQNNQDLRNSATYCSLAGEACGTGCCTGNYCNTTIFKCVSNNIPTSTPYPTTPANGLCYTGGNCASIGRLPATSCVPVCAQTMSCCGGLAPTTTPVITPTANPTPTTYCSGSGVTCNQTSYGCCPGSYCNTSINRCVPNSVPTSTPIPTASIKPNGSCYTGGSCGFIGRLPATVCSPVCVSPLVCCGGLAPTTTPKPTAKLTPTPTTKTSKNIITINDYTNCLNSGNTPIECSSILANIGKTYATGQGQRECSSGSISCSGNTMKICSASGTWGILNCQYGCNTYGCNDASSSTAYNPNALPSAINSVNPPGDPFSLTQNPQLAATINQQLLVCEQLYPQSQCVQALSQAAPTKDSCVAFYMLSNLTTNVSTAKSKCNSDRAGVLSTVTLAVAGGTVVIPAAEAVANSGSIAALQAYLLSPSGIKMATSLGFTLFNGAITGSSFINTYNSCTNTGLLSSDCIGNALNTVAAALLTGASASNLVAQQQANKLQAAADVAIAREKILQSGQELLTELKTNYGVAVLKLSPSSIAQYIEADGGNLISHNGFDMTKTSFLDPENNVIIINTLDSEGLYSEYHEAQHALGLTTGATQRLYDFTSRFPNFDQKTQYQFAAALEEIRTTEKQLYLLNTTPDTPPNLIEHAASYQQLNVKIAQSLFGGTPARLTSQFTYLEQLKPIDPVAYSLITYGFQH